MDPIEALLNSAAFEPRAHVERVNRMPYVPGIATAYFDANGITTTYYTFEYKTGVVTLVPLSERGAPPAQTPGATRAKITLQVPHLAQERPVTAEKIQNLLQVGSAEALQTAQSVIDEETQELLANNDATIEWHSIGAMNGIILDADGNTVVTDLYSLFKIEQTSIDVPLSVAATKVRGVCTQITDAVDDALGGVASTGYEALCGRGFYKKFFDHDVVRKDFERVRDGASNRDDGRKARDYGDITWRRYPGKVGGHAAVADDEALVFPTGVHRLFRRLFAPGDFLDTVNQVGLPRYVRLARDPSGLNRMVNIHVQSNPLHFCTRPEAVIRVKAT